MNTPKTDCAKADGKAEGQFAGFAELLLAWYDRHARVLPWRMPPVRSKKGERMDAYKVWLSEIMLQQTQVATVRDYYEKFIRHWPDIEALAQADIEDVLKAWAGLGYYSRARNLKKCAEIVSAEHGGEFPRDEASLRRLPGIGEYTASAIAAIAFGKPAPVVDGNVDRVVCRLLRLETPVRSAKETIRGLAGNLLPVMRPGDFAQAMMDLGAGLCSPKKPACSLCPVNTLCTGWQSGNPELYPVKLAKAEKPKRRGAAFVILNANGEVYLQKRSDKGLLAGMSELPGTHWTACQDGLTGSASLPFDANWKFAGTARHTFTHFHLELEVWQCEWDRPLSETGWWVPASKLHGEALPTLMKKAIGAALPDAFRKGMK
jgi:A/G-specific adenine glycosylase